MFGMFLLELLSTLDVDMVDDIHVNTWFFNLISAGICLNFPSILLSFFKLCSHSPSVPRTSLGLKQ